MSQLASSCECALWDFQKNVWVQCYMHIFEFLQVWEGTRKEGGRECVGVD